jgi:epoxyqueuosine reductase
MDTKTSASLKMAQLIESEIKSFVRNSPLNRMPDDGMQPIFNDPLVKFADGNDPLFAEFKTIIGPNHLTPIEALAMAYNKQPEDDGKLVSVVSWVLPVARKTRESNREQTTVPSRYWAYTKYYGEKFNNALRKHIVEMFTIRGYMTTAPEIQPYFKIETNEKGRFSNWSERHVAYVAGQGTFSLSDGFITEHGIAHRCGSVVIDLKLPPSPRTATAPFSNCLYYVNKSCKACIARCPAGAITEAGHDKIKCYDYLNLIFKQTQPTYQGDVLNCGLCQTRVPCEYTNPTKKQGSGFPKVLSFS